MKVHFERTEKMEDVIKEILFAELDNPQYQFLFDSDWDNVPKPFETLGWGDDAFLIMVGGVDDSEVAGYIRWNYSRSQNKIAYVIVALKRDYLGKGIGAVALAKWLDYAINARRFRKIEFACFADNKAALRLYTQIKDLGGKIVGTKKESSKLRDGKYHDMILFEILRKDFKSTRLFQRFVDGKGAA